MDLTRHGIDQAEDPIKTQYPEEEEEQEHGATKMFRRVKAKAKQIKESITKHAQHDKDVDEEDDENDEKELGKHGAPVNESSSVKGDVPFQPEVLSHSPGTDVSAPEEIIPPGTKVFPVVSSDYTKSVEPELLRDTSKGHESPSRTLQVSDLSEREETKEVHHEPNDTPASLLFKTEDVTKTFDHGGDEYIEGQSIVNTETPKRLEEDPATPGGGGGEAEIVEIDKSHDQKTGLGFETDLATRSNDFELSEDFPKKSHEFDQKVESGMGKDTGVVEKPGTEMREDFLAKSNEFDQEIESGIGKDSPTGFDRESETEQVEDLPAKSHEFDQKMESGIGIDKDTELIEKPGTEMREDFLRKSDEFDQEIESGIGKDPPTVLGKEYPARSDDVEVENLLSNDQFSPELSHPKESDKLKQVEEENVTINSDSGETIGEKQESQVGEVAGTVAEKLTSVEEDKDASAIDHLAEKLTTGERDKAISDVIAEKLSLGGDEKKTTSKEVEVMVEKRFGNDWKIKPLQWTVIVFFAVCIIYYVLKISYT